MSYGQGGSQWGPGAQWGQQQDQPPSQWGQPPPATTPDWDALASDAERQRKRRRLFTVLGGAAAALVVGTLVALAIVLPGDSGGDDEAGGGADPTETADAGGGEPAPTFSETNLPPLPKPREFISDADKDTADFTAEEFFGDAGMVIDEREYALDAVHGTEDCAAATTPELAEALAEHGCTALLRATYRTGEVSVTVGVAQFPGETEASGAREAATSHLTPLTSGDAANFCQSGGCRTTKNQVGRYAYFTIAGNNDNAPDSGDDTPALQAARDGNEHAHARVVQRGEAQASASASALVEERQQQEDDD